MPEGAIIPLKSVYCERIGFQIGFVNTDRKSTELEAEANARLISAAPDLLAFAQTLLEDYQSEDGMLSMKQYARMAYEAIVKATGATP